MNIKGTLISLSSCIIFSLFTAQITGQTNKGTLKVFSDEPVMVFVDQVHQPEYGSIPLVAGTHYLKVLNKDEVKVYSNIVTIVKGEVTSVLIENVNTRPAAAGKNIPSSVPVSGKNEGAVFNSNPDNNTPQAANHAPDEKTAPAGPAINIGQVNGRLPADKSGAFGLFFGMSGSDVDKIMEPQIYSAAQKGKGYSSYAMLDKTKDQEKLYAVECRFIDDKLFQILVAYPTVNFNESSAKNKLILDKNVVPVSEYNMIYAELTKQYGEPTSSEKIYKGNYSEGDGRLAEGLKKKQVLILSDWINSDTGNETYLAIAYTTAPLVFVAYQDGRLSREAQQRKLVVHSYKYENSYKDNYFGK